MKSIKIKIRTLIIIGLLSILGIVYSEQISHTAASLIHKIGDLQDKAYLALDPSSLYGENKRLEIILDKHDYELYNLVALGDGMSSYSSRIRYQDAINVYKSYESFKKEALKKENYDYMINVALIQWFSGLLENTEKVLEDMPLSQLDQGSKDHYHLLKAMMALTFHDLEAVEKELDQVSKAYDQVVNASKAYMANIFKYDIAYEALENKNIKGDFAPYLEEITIGVKEYLLQSTHNDIYGQDLTLKGRVTIDGEPVAGAMVYAKGYKGLSSYEGYSKYMTVTDDKGYYTLMSKDKMKGLGIKLPWHLILDKRIERQWQVDYTDHKNVDFEFESGLYFKTAFIEDGYFIYEIEDKKEGQEYTLKISHADPSYVNDHTYYSLTEKKGRIPLEDLHRVTRFRFGWMSSLDPFNIKMFTEPLYLSGDYYFSVDRVSENSGYSTNGIFSDQLKTVIYYEGVDYNEGDLLIKEGKIDEAVKWYEENPNRHNLKVLIALYTHGRKGKEEKYQQRLYDNDLGKAIYYSKMLIDLDGVTSDRLSSLADLYKGQKNYQEEAKILEQVIEESDVVYNYLRLARSTVNSGQYMEGIEIYLKHGDMALDGDRYYDIFILGDQLLALPDEIKDNLLIKDRSDFHGFFRDIQSGHYEAAYDQLMAMKDSPLKTFYYLLFLEAFEFEFIDYPFEVQRNFITHKSGFLDYYVETTKTIGDKDLKSILMFMKERNNWF